MLMLEAGDIDARIEATMWRRSASCPADSVTRRSGHPFGQLAVVVKTNGIPFWGRCTRMHHPF